MSARAPLAGREGRMLPQFSPTGAEAGIGSRGRATTACLALALALCSTAVVGLMLKGRFGLELADGGAAGSASLPSSPFDSEHDFSPPVGKESGGTLATASPPIVTGALPSGGTPSSSGFPLPQQKPASNVPSSSSDTGKKGSHPAAIPTLVVAGNLTVHGKPTTLAQYEPTTGAWYTTFQPQLYLYREAAGEIHDMVVSPSEPYDNLYIVGSFDTVCKTCQQLYCSVGFWTGDEFLKVGDGLCPRATDVAMKIEAALLTPDSSFFVGGTFQSRVWSGQKFVNIYNIARYASDKDAWLPLLSSSNNSTNTGGGLGCNWCTVSVLSLAWNERSQTLYIGGKFNMVNSQYIEAGLAMWTKKGGIEAFPGGGLSYETPTTSPSDYVLDAVATSLIYDDESRRLFVAGTFEKVNGQPCSSVAVWWDELERWDCLWDPRHSFSLITSMLYTKGMLYVAGMPTQISTWDHSLEITHTIARMGQSSAVFGGKYQDWADHNEGGVGGDGVSEKKGDGESSSPPSSEGDLGPSGDSNPHAGEGEEPSSAGNSPGHHHRKSRHLGAVSTSGPADTSAGGITPSSSPAEGGMGGGDATGANQMGACRTSSSVAESGETCYRYFWEWLPGFGGVNGPIHKLFPGTGAFSKSIMIGGGFAPPVLIWTEDTRQGPSSGIMGSVGELEGVVTSIVQMNLPPPDAPKKDDHSTGTQGQGASTPAAKRGPGVLTLVVLIVCIFLGICLGIGMAFTCHNQQYMNVPWLKHMVEGRNGISLTTLAGSYGLMGDMENEIKQHFDRAMQARHLWKGYNLNAINPKEIVLHRIIGEGSFGRVWSGMWRNSPVAVKEFVFAQAAVAGNSLQRDELIEEIVGEATIMSFLRHPRILHLYGCSLTSQAIWIVSELCSRGSLRQVLDDRSTELTPLQSLHMAIDIAEGMHHLHSREQPIIHRDLKSHNIFIQEGPDGAFMPKIGDWGSARAVALHTKDMRTMTHGVGTACWLAPEVIKHARGNKQSDVYSYGIILWELATRMDVHPSLSAAQIIARVASEGLRPKVPRHCPWKDVMQACWSEDPEKRPSFAEVIRQLEDVLAKMGSDGGPPPLSFPPPLPSKDSTGGQGNSSAAFSVRSDRTGSRERSKRRSRTYSGRLPSSEVSTTGTGEPISVHAEQGGSAKSVAAVAAAPTPWSAHNSGSVGESRETGQGSTPAEDIIRLLPSRDGGQSRDGRGARSGRSREKPPTSRNLWPSKKSTSK